ncbi:MAG: thiamine-phosphate pyrophosphorylase [Candidatus Omnitrophota bacterium]
MKKKVHRAIDANFNRVKEGLRVCEDFTRFFLEDTHLTEKFKKMRADVGKLYEGIPRLKSELMKARDAITDVGKKLLPAQKRKDFEDLFWANVQRSKEALRTLEEFSALVKEDFSEEFKQLRFSLYDLEKKTFKKLQAVPRSKRPKKKTAAKKRRKKASSRS